MAKRTLTDRERGIILLGVSEYLQRSKETSQRASDVATDAGPFDDAMAHILEDRRLAEELQEAIDTAEDIQLVMPDR